MVIVKKNRKFMLFTFLLGGLLTLSNQAYGFFINGGGHYSLRGETRTHPRFAKDSGYHQGIDQNFRLDAEIRSSDTTSFNFEFRIFDDHRKAYMGDNSDPNDCSEHDDGRVRNTGSSSECKGRHQNSLMPGYEGYTPKVTKAYAKIATPYCLIEAGRRGRHWGMGMYLNEGTGHFDTEWSIYDGVTCDINIQKTQTLGFSVGYDKITETGADISMESKSDTTYGAAKPSDDLDQYFFTIEYDNRKVNAGKDFSQHIGIYFANIMGGDDLDTDIKIADLYLSFYLKNFIIQQEVLFRLGKSADPTFARLGGKSSFEDEIVTNDVNSIAAAGKIEYILSKSGSIVGPAEYNQGNFESHSLFLEYAFAPGDRDGYQSEYDSSGNRVERKNKTATAVAFHRNFKPALLLFNGRSQSDKLRVDGIFDPGRVMNTTVVGLGYQFKSIDSGNVEVKLVGAQLNNSMPKYIKDQYIDAEKKPIGYYSRDLGYELDVKYNMKLGKRMEWGFAGAAAIPGDAWKVEDGEDATINFLLQAHSTFKF